ncbi:pol-like protein [Lasius niger]|uniref:Pol-like protein n=1 Tax=Lasius niger TaxID=67767 RepID=A0A0J7K9D3_LASNI|nr:pol-like protein [Lasius niger]
MRGMEYEDIGQDRWDQRNMKVASNIDLIFAEVNIVDNISYDQIKDTWGSDHFPLDINTDAMIIRYKKITNRISNKNTNWTDYMEYVQKEVETLGIKVNQGSLQERYTRFTELLKEAVYVVSGRINKRKGKDSTGSQWKQDRRNHQQVKWWDAECEKTVKERKEKLKIYKRIQDLHSFIEYKRQVAIVKKIIKRKKRDCFTDFCNSISRTTSWKYLWNVMRTFKKSWNKVQWNKWQEVDREQVIREEIDKLSPPGVSETDEHEWDDVIINENHSLDSLFTQEELNRALNLVKKDSAPGRDNIDYKMLKNLPQNAKTLLLEIYNEIWCGDSIPQEWYQYQVLFIDKGNKRKVRPISLSSCVGKVMERLVNQRLVWWAESHDKCHPWQNGFRRGRSCAENLVSLTADIRTALYGDEYGMAAFLDVSSAYDNVQFNILKGKLRFMQCPRRIHYFISRWLRDREIEYIINQQEKIIRVARKGLPQGAVLSPGLYALYTNDITIDTNDQVRILQFADDIGVYKCGINRRCNRDSIEEAVNIIAMNLQEIGLALEPKKTTMVEFSRSGYIDNNLYISIGGTQVYCEKEAKFL